MLIIIQFLCFLSLVLSDTDGSDRADDVNVKDRHFMYGFGSDIDRELRRVYQRILGEIVCSFITT